MQITELNQPIGRGTLYCGMAVSTRGVRYKWDAMPNGKSASCYREHTRAGFWQQVKPPKALEHELQKQLREVIS